MHNFYYSLIIDTSLEEVIVPEELANEILDEFLAIVVPMIAVGIVVPLIMVYCDAKDYKKIEDNFYGVDDLTYAKLERALDYLCTQQVYYNEIEISKYHELDEGVFRPGSWTSFAIFNRRLNPYCNIWQHFDYRMKRLMRFSLFLA